MMMRLSPSPTLFPYTTLFRSQHIRPLKRFRGAADKAGTRGARAKRATKAAFLPASRGIVTSFWGHRYGGKGDRKSTRLNSSHRCNSYAVFCLKKKKETTTRQR